MTKKRNNNSSSFVQSAIEKKKKDEAPLTLKEMVDYQALFKQPDPNDLGFHPDELSDDDLDFFQNSSFATANLENSKFEKLSLTKQMEKEGVSKSEIRKKRKSMNSGDRSDSEDEEEDDESEDDNQRRWEEQDIIKKRLPIKTNDGKIRKVTEVINPLVQKMEQEKLEKHKEKMKKDFEEKNKRKQPQLKQIEKKIQQEKEQPTKKQKTDDKDQDGEEEDEDLDNEMDDLIDNNNFELEYNENEEDDSNNNKVEMTEAEKYLKQQEQLENSKMELAKISTKIINNPELNITLIKDIFSICLNNRDMMIKKYSVLSLCALFKDIIPGYRISKSSENEIANQQQSSDVKRQKVKLSKEVKQIREFESRLLKFYQNYLVLIDNSINTILALLQRKPLPNRQISFFKPNIGYTGRELSSMLNCILKSVTTLLVSHPHFNYRTNLVTITTRFTVYKEKEVSMMCLGAIKNLFENDTTGGETSLEVVRCLSNVAKLANYYIDPKVLRIFMAIRLTDVVEKINPFGYASDKNYLNKKEQHHITRSQKKQKKEEKQIDKEMKEAEAEYTVKEQRYLQTEILKSIFITYFRIIKKAPGSPALSAVLEGLAKFSHLISVDFLGDLLSVLSGLIANGITSLSNALNANITAFKTIKLHGNTLNVDLKDYYSKVYTLLTDFVLPGEYHNCLNAINAISLMLGDKKQTAIERVAAFIKRLSTITLFLPTNASMGIVALCKQLFVTYTKSQRLLEIDRTYSGGDYIPESTDPDHCNPFASTLWELTLLCRHWHPQFEPIVRRILAFNSDAAAHQITREKSPLELYRIYDASSGGFNPPIQMPKEHPLLGKIRKLKKSFKGKEIKVHITPSQEYEKSDFMKQLESIKKSTTQQEQKQPTTFNNYYHEIKEYKTQMKLHKKLQSLQILNQKIHQKSKDNNNSNNNKKKSLFYQMSLQQPISLRKENYHDKVKEIEGTTTKVYWSGDGEIKSIQDEIIELQKIEQQINNELEPYQMELKKMKDETNKNLDKVHKYNELKDSTQTLIGRLADYEGLTITQMYKKFDIQLDD
eukprot:gene547-691_t